MPWQASGIKGGVNIRPLSVKNFFRCLQGVVRKEARNQTNSCSGLKGSIQIGENERSKIEGAYPLNPSMKEV